MKEKPSPEAGAVPQSLTIAATERIERELQNEFFELGAKASYPIGQATEMLESADDPMGMAIAAHDTVYPDTQLNVLTAAILRPPSKTKFRFSQEELLELNAHPAIRTMSNAAISNMLTDELGHMILSKDVSAAARDLQLLPLQNGHNTGSKNALRTYRGQFNLDQIKAISQVIRGEKPPTIAKISHPPEGAVSASALVGQRVLGLTPGLLDNTIKNFNLPSEKYVNPETGRVETYVSAYGARRVFEIARAELHRQGSSRQLED